VYNLNIFTYTWRYISVWKLGFFVYSGLFILDREHRLCVCVCECAHASSAKCGELCSKLQKAKMLARITLDDLYPWIDLYLLMIHFAHELQNLFLLFWKASFQHCVFHLKVACFFTCYAYRNTHSIILSIMHTYPPRLMFSSSPLLLHSYTRSFPKIADSEADIHLSIELGSGTVITYHMCVYEKEGWVSTRVESCTWLNAPKRVYHVVTWIIE
jgi:hypothetical protein